MAFFTFRCWHCDGHLALAKNGLCSTCQKQISSPTYCFHCGNPLAHYAEFCGKCAPFMHVWQNMVIAGTYRPPLSTLIQRFKFQRQFYLDRTLARLLFLAVKNARREQYFPLPEALIPVPLHKKRQWSRGFNQSELLARFLAQWFHLTLENNLIYRIKNTPTQRGQNAHSRRKNVHQSFAFNLAKKGQYQSVAIIDDVITTGATVAEIAKTLRQHGIKRIQVWGVARA